MSVQAPRGAGKTRELPGEAKDLDLERQFTESPCSGLGMGCRKDRWKERERKGRRDKGTDGWGERKRKGEQERPMIRGKKGGRERKKEGERKGERGRGRRKEEGETLRLYTPQRPYTALLLTQEGDVLHQESAWRVQPGSESMVPPPLPPPLLLSCLLYLYSFTQRPVPTRVLSTQALTATEGARPEAFKGSSHLFRGWISVSIYPSIDVDTESPDYVHICSRLFHPGPALS